MNTALSWLRFALANVQPIPMLAFALVAAVVIVQLAVLPAREEAIEVAERKLVKLERDLRRAAIQRQSVQVSPEETRKNLLGRFPDEASLNGILGRLLDLARSHGLQVLAGDYRLAASKEAALTRYVLNLPVKGGYLTVRRYVAATRAEFPHLAVEDIALRRENIGKGEVEVQLRFVLFARKAPL